jgi:glycerophosphoryl diester phosphodiesterase
VSARSPDLAPLKRVGHKGADLVAPGNTLESFRAALEHGVDMIEFDVLRLRDGRVVLAHDLHDASTRQPVTLDEGLAHFAGEAYAGVELDVDLKQPGYEREVIEGLAAHGLTERSLVSSTYMETMDLLGELAPGLRRGWSVPRAKRDYTRSIVAPAVYALLRAVRLWLPRRAGAMVRAGRFEAIMVHQLLVSPRLVAEVRAAGGLTYVWTVDDGPRIETLSAIGVDGVITNDPRLFEPATS